MIAAVALSGTGKAAANVTFTYDVTTSTLHYNATTTAPADTVIALTLQRGTAGKPGPVLFQLIPSGLASKSDDLRLRSHDRADLADGKLFVHLYTKDMPLGAGRAAVTLPKTAAIAR